MLGTEINHAAMKYGHGARARYCVYLLASAKERIPMAIATPLFSSLHVNVGASSAWQIMILGLPG